MDNRFTFPEPRHFDPDPSAMLVCASELSNRVYEYFFEQGSVPARHSVLMAAMKLYQRVVDIADFDFPRKWTFADDCGPVPSMEDAAEILESAAMVFTYSIDQRNKWRVDPCCAVLLGSIAHLLCGPYLQDEVFDMYRHVYDTIALENVVSDMNERLMGSEFDED